MTPHVKEVDVSLEDLTALPPPAWAQALIPLGDVLALP